MVKNNPSIWSRKLDDALWVFRTEYETPIGTTPYRLLYGKSCHLPFEKEHRAYWALRSHIIVAGVENRPPMLEKSMYDSWASRIRLFIKGKKHGWMMLDSIDNGLLVYLTVEENRQTRPKKYSKFTEAQQL
nr:reverse transcriptase domain-containing protein [Tanacetum cinerariifolium]